MVSTAPLCFLAVLILLFSPMRAFSQSSSHEREIAARFAPVFYQALGDKPRSDFITNFDFDGDWRGDNNWAHTDDEKFALRAYVYYAVVETATHFFIHYAVFHPRDYKGGERKGRILSELMRKGAERGDKYDPTGLAEEAALAHENDLEGCLVVVAKNGKGLDESRVAFVETLHHNIFSRYAAVDTAQEFAPIRIDGQHVLLYIEPKGHGIEAYTGDQKQTAKKEFLSYRYMGRAEDPMKGRTEIPVCRDLNECPHSISFELVPIPTTLWAKAQGGTNMTYGAACDYRQITIQISDANGRSNERKITVGKIGCAFLGRIGGHDMARPPWAWFDKNQRDRPLGLWFFDPANTIKRDFHLDEKFSTTYLRLPFWAAANR